MHDVARGREGGGPGAQAAHERSVEGRPEDPEEEGADHSARVRVVARAVVSLLLHT